MFRTSVSPRSTGARPPRSETRTIA
jgi:hypothetical protein